MARRTSTTKRPRRSAPEESSSLPAPVELSPTEQLLTFLIGEDEYGISIHRVREIAEYRGLTPVPMTAGWMRGVMNLRGTVVPVVDLAARLGLEPTVISRRTCLVIVEMDVDGERVVVAVMVAGVSRVIDVPRAEIQEAPPFGLGIDFVPGLVRVEETLIVLLDLPTILATTDLAGAAAFLPALREEAGEGVHAQQ